MKKHFLLSTAVMLSMISFAQVKPVFGINAGLTQAAMQGDAVTSLENLISFSNGAITTKSSTSFFAGGFVGIPVADKFSIEPGIYYTQKGYELSGNLSMKGAEFLSAGAKAQLTTNYIDVPVIAKVKLSGLQLFAGPQASYLAGAQLRTTVGALGFNVLDKTMDARDQFNQWDFALTGGVGYQFSNGVNFRASYDHGLSKVDKGQNIDSYNRVIKVGIGFTF